MIDPAGFGSQGFVALGSQFPYRINFENEPTATAPAQRVDVTDQLDPDLDWSTFALAEVGFGDTIIAIPAGVAHYQTSVPVTYNGKTFDVQIELGLDSATGQVYAHFLSIDPKSQLPPDVLTGFLPPEDGTGRGQGYFAYTILPKSGLPTGREIRNVALISFDGQPIIATNQVDPHDPGAGTDLSKEALNTMDAGPPTSSVGPLPPTETSASFSVPWSGQDDPAGSGVGSYNVYVSDNGGPFTLWQSATAATSAMFTGQDGHSYAFYSVATDNVGNAEANLGTAQASTQVPESNHAPALAAIADREIAEGSKLTLTATATDSDLPAQHLTYSLVGGLAGATIDPVTGAFAWTSSTPGTFTVTVRVADDGSPSRFSDRTFTVNVVNVAPTVAAGPNATITRGAALARVGSFSDPGAGPWTATVDYGDGTGEQPLGLNADRTFALSHVYNTAGTRAVVVRVHDSHDGLGTATFNVVVNAPPVDKTPPRVVSLTRTGLSLATVALKVVYSEAVDVARAQDVKNYLIRSAGRDGRFGTRDDGLFAVKSARLDSTRRVVTLKPKSLLSFSTTYRLKISAARPNGVKDRAGNLLDGNRDGRAGGNFLRTFRGQGPGRV